MGLVNFPVIYHIDGVWYTYASFMGLLKTERIRPLPFSSVTQLCPTHCDPKDCSTPGLPVHYQLPGFTQTHVHWVGDAIQNLILYHLLLFLPSIFPSIRVFSNESVLHIRWPKHWSLSFSNSPSNEYSGLAGLISLLSKGLFEGIKTTVWRHQFFSTQPFLLSRSHICTWLLEKS